MEIKLNEKESEEYFLNALCNGMDYICDSYGLELIIEDSEYEKAKNELKGKTTFSQEDIWMKILKDGGKLSLNDEEGEETKSITIKDVHEKVQLTPIEHLRNMIDENDDAETADVILQTVFYGEIVFG